MSNDPNGEFPRRARVPVATRAVRLAPMRWRSPEAFWVHSWTSLLSDGGVRRYPIVKRIVKHSFRAVDRFDRI